MTDLGPECFDARARAISLRAFPEVVAAALNILGDQLMAFIGHADDPRTVRAWAEGKEAPDRETDQRLRVACYAAVLLNEREGKATVRSWFLGMNPDLDGNAAAELLFDGTSAEAAGVEDAARSFWING
jgi:hypothetical protein